MKRIVNHVGQKERGRSEGQMGLIVMGERETGGGVFWVLLTELDSWGETKDIIQLWQGMPAGLVFHHTDKAEKRKRKTPNREEFGACSEDTNPGKTL